MYSEHSQGFYLGVSGITIGTGIYTGSITGIKFGTWKGMGVETGTGVPIGIGY